jgi:hypothetical protein
VLDENSGNVSILFQEDDPLPVLGLIYPLAVFLRHGSLGTDVLTSTG